MIRRYQSVKEKRKARVRARIKGSAVRPRLSVFRSNRHIYAQIINDEKGKTLVAASEADLSNLKADGKHAALKTLKGTGNTENTENTASVSSGNSVSSVLQKKHLKTDRAMLVGQLLAKKALKKGIKKVVFDRGSYKYHGRVKALAEGARESGLKF